MHFKKQILNKLRILSLVLFFMGTLYSCKKIRVNWNGICNSQGQPGAPITLSMNLSMTGLSSPLFQGSCGALGSPCEVSFGIQSATSANDSFAYLILNFYEGATCSGAPIAMSSVTSALSTDTLGIAVNALGGCSAGEYIGIGPLTVYSLSSPSSPNSMIISTTYLPGQTTPYSCSVPGYQLMPVSLCIPCM